MGAVLLSVLVLILLILWWYYYPYPSGKRPSLWMFVGFWFRELLLLAPIVIALVLCSLVWAWREIRKLFVRGREDT